jgi:hypothetical protein
MCGTDHGFLTSAESNKKCNPNRNCGKPFDDTDFLMVINDL